MIPERKYTALWNVMKRECRRLVSRPLYLFCMVVAPLFCYIFFTTLMGSGLPTDMPVGIVDQDMTSTTRQLTRTLDSFQQSKVVAHYPTFNEAREAMQRGDIYGFYYIPEGTTAEAQAQRRRLKPAGEQKQVAPAIADVKPCHQPFLPALASLSISAM